MHQHQHHPSHVLGRGPEQHQRAGGFHRHHHVGDGAVPPDLPRSPNPSSKSSSNLTAATFAPPRAAAYGGVTASLGIAAAPGMADAGGRFCQPWAQFENWGDSGIVVTSPLTDTASTDVDDKHDAQMGGGSAQKVAVKVDPSVVSKERPGDHKVQRRLAQNREAARKSRIRKKAYIEELESSRAKLAQLEQELQRARQQGMFIASGCSGEHGYPTGGGALAFDVEYARWLDEHQRHMSDLRAALSSPLAPPDPDLRALVDAAMAHYEQAFRLKSAATRGDVFHVMSGMWVSPAERFFLWLGGFRPSEVLRAVAAQLDASATEQQLVGICTLQQTAVQAEDALSQGMDVLQQTLAETLASAAGGAGAADSVTNYVGQMAMAMAKLGTLENFLRQADLLRQQTLEQMRRILSTRQSARALLVINDYFSRLRALSSLWLARPRD